jgi:chromate transporter
MPNTSADNHAPTRPTPAGSVVEVFAAFLKLGLTSFGGPIAHLEYYRRAFVERGAWVGESQFAQLLALCQFLPGPRVASSVSALACCAPAGSTTERAVGVG